LKKVDKNVHLLNCGHRIYASSGMYQCKTWCFPPHRPTQKAFTYISHEDMQKVSK